MDIRYFSIIIPLFNKGNYIIRCLQSITNQSYNYYEVIVVNDGSTDGGELLVSSFEGESIRIINQKNQGVSIARNEGVMHSNYNYIVFLDADDTLEPNFLLEMNYFIDRYPNSGIYGANYFCNYSNGKIAYSSYIWLFNGNSDGWINDYFSLFAKLGKSPFSNSGLCIERNIFNEVGGYYPGIRLTEDSEFWCRIALKHKIAFITKPLVNYYFETPGNTRSIIEFKDYQVSITLQKYISNNQVPKEFIKSVKKLIAFQQLSLVKRAILTNHRKFALSKLFDKRIIKMYPLKILKILLILIIPNYLIVKIKGRYN